MSRLRSVKPPVKSLLRNHLIELASPDKPASGRCLPRSARSLRAGPGRGCNPSRTRAPRDVRRPRSHREPSRLRLLRFRLAPLRGGSAAAYGRPGHTLRASGGHQLPPDGRRRLPVRGRLRGSPRFGAHRVRGRLERHPDLGLAPPRGRPSAIHEADPTPWRAPRAGRRGRDARVGPSRRFVGTMPPAPPEIS